MDAEKLDAVTASTRRITILGALTCYYPVLARNPCVYTQIDQGFPRI